MSFGHIEKYIWLVDFTLVVMAHLSEHKRPTASGMLQAGLRASHIARLFNCHPSTINRLRERFQATGTVKIEDGLVNQG